MALSVILLEKDPSVAHSLAGGLRPHFSVHVTHTREELRDNLSRNRPEAMILSMEVWQLPELASLHRDFPEVPIVCTHRIPDEEMWAAALAAGACDMCPADDVNNVLTSVLRSTAVSRSAAA